MGVFYKGNNTEYNRNQSSNSTASGRTFSSYPILIIASFIETFQSHKYPERLE